MNKKIISLVTSAISLLLPVMALAAGPTATEWFNGVLNNFLNIVVWPVFITISIAMFVWAGILYLSAEGEASKISAAHRAVVYGIIGIVVALLGFSAVNIIGTIITPIAPPG